jgi:probable HAF family extracellular repeat protein
MIGLGDLAGGTFQSFALGVSADGSVVVGWSSSANGSEAFRWTPDGGMVGLGDLPGGGFASYAQNVSANGRVIVGRSASFNGDSEAFRWENGIWQPLGSLGYLPFFSFAYAVSADGSVVVGWARAAGGTGTVEAFRWRASTGTMVGLGELEGGSYDSRAYAVSADGRLVGGFGTSESGKEAVLWDHEGVIYCVKDLLLNAGITEVLNWRLEEVRALSADGTVIVGTGTNPSNQRESWVAVLPRFDRRLEDIDLSGCIDDADLLTVLFAFGNTGYFDPADVNYDGAVDDADLLQVLFNFGSGC